MMMTMIAIVAKLALCMHGIKIMHASHGFLCLLCTTVQAQHLRPSVFFQSPALQTGTFSLILSGTRRSVQTVSDAYFKHISLLDTNMDLEHCGS